MTEWNHRICERCWFDGSPERLVRADDNRGNVDLYDGKGRVWDLIEQGQPLGLITEGEHQGAYRMPVQVTETEPGACCVCGGMTITGIFVRKDEQELLCKGRHAPEDLASWSRVGL